MINSLNIFMIIANQITCIGTLKLKPIERRTKSKYFKIKKRNRN